MSEKPSYLNSNILLKFIENALKEDIGAGDYSTLASIDEGTKGHASLIIKEEGILAGVEVTKEVLRTVDSSLHLNIYKQDGEIVNPGDQGFSVSGSARSILSSERLVLNIMQRMSGIATKTARMNSLIKGTGAKLLDTRKTTPNFRAFEKWAVKIGGGQNHRFALYDMIMLKDNHNDYAGGITKAVEKTKSYLSKNGLDLRIEVETRTIEEVREALASKVDIILLDNMSIDQLREAVNVVANKCQTEASGGINENNILEVAKTGVDYISVGALTHSFKSLDMSLKASLHK